MNGMNRTRHFRQRMQQRGVTDAVVETLLRYGVERQTCGGASSLSFTKSALAEVRSDLGVSEANACERLRNTYVIVSGGSLITVARSYRKAR